MFLERFVVSFDFDQGRMGFAEPVGKTQAPLDRRRGPLDRSRFGRWNRRAQWSAVWRLLEGMRIHMNPGQEYIQILDGWGMILILSSNHDAFCST